MAWGNNREIDWKEEFGVESKEELKARLAEVNTLKTANTALEGKVATQDGELNTVKATLTTIEAKLNTRVEPPTNNNNNNNNIEIPSVMDDESGAFASRMAPLYKQNMENTAMIIEDQTLRRISGSDPRFGRMEKDIRKLIADTPLQLRANTTRTQDGRTVAEQVIENAYYVVKGRYADQIAQDTVAGKGEFFVEPARGSGNTGNTTQQTDPTILTDEDRRVIQKMGVSEKVYQQILKDGGPNMGGALSNKTSL
jgi:hypothetical protein